MHRLFTAAAVVGAVALVAIGAAQVLSPGPSPRPSRATAVIPQCPPPTEYEYLFGPSGPFADAPDPATKRSLSARLQIVDQTPLWCGHATEEAYRFVATGYWDGPRLATVTVARRAGRWTLRAAEHTPSTFLVAAPVSGVNRDVANAEMMVLLSALEADRFWELSVDEPQSTVAHEPIDWYLEGHKGNGYHYVSRGYHRIQIVHIVRALLILADLDRSWMFQRMRR